MDTEAKFILWLIGSIIVGLGVIPAVALVLIVMMTGDANGCS